LVNPLKAARIAERNQTFQSSGTIFALSQGVFSTTKPTVFGKTTFQNLLKNKSAE
jgi:hypothetical protein